MLKLSLDVIAARMNEGVKIMEIRQMNRQTAVKKACAFIYFLDLKIAHFFTKAQTNLFKTKRTNFY